MAARPNTVKSLQVGQQLAENQVKRLGETIAKASGVLENNPKLTVDEVGEYKAAIRAGKKMITAFERVAKIDVPNGKSNGVTAAPKKRGRPSKAKVEAAPEEPQKKRGRPRKVQPEVEAVTASAPKKRGRPRKVQPEAEAPVVSQGPKRRGRPPKAKVEAAPAEAPKAKRGRPKGSKNNVQAVEAVTEVVEADTPKKRGRPKGSKNKPKEVAVAA